MLKDILIKTGFSSQEAEIYLATLHWGTKPASAIAQKTGLNRVTAYQILEKMVKKGIINNTVRAKIKYYTAEKPENIIDILERDKTQIDKRIEMISKHLPEFANIVNPNHIDPSFRLYTGIEGIKALYGDTLKGEGPIYALLDGSCIDKDLEGFLNNTYLAKRIKKGIPVKVLMPKNKYNQTFRKEDKSTLRECRFVPASKYTYEMEINIYNNKVAFFSFKKEELMATLIKSEPIYNTMRAIFDSLWNIAK